MIIFHYHVILLLLFRHFSAQRAQLNRAASDEAIKMSVGGSSLRNMSVSHWKLLSHLKEYMSKSSSNEKGVLFVLNKEWLSLLQKLQMIYSSVQSGTQKNFDSNTSTVAKQISEKESPKSDTKKPAAKEDKGYSLPQALTGFKLKNNSSLSAEVFEELVPKWKSSKESVSKVEKGGPYTSTMYWFSGFPLFNASNF
jgi:hypothetical protein